VLIVIPISNIFDINYWLLKNCSGTNAEIIITTLLSTMTFPHCTCPVYGLVSTEPSTNNTTVTKHKAGIMIDASLLCL
jgi:hypothetical protein